MIKDQKTFTVKTKATVSLYSREIASQDILTWAQDLKIHSFVLFA